MPLNLDLGPSTVTPLSLGPGTVTPLSLGPGTVTPLSLGLGPGTVTPLSLGPGTVTPLSLGLGPDTVTPLSLGPGTVTPLSLGPGTVTPLSLSRQRSLPSLISSKINKGRGTGRGDNYSIGRVPLGAPACFIAAEVSGATTIGGGCSPLPPAAFIKSVTDALNRRRRHALSSRWPVYPPTTLPSLQVD
ncbi:hypothetical protein C0Q70_11108 [Pomacea canaliculata]|uniref:Uncharacterized protein n=1 Tax=Pomacea canaliculata TaxID=400727 RepID=A0A2T7P535_POMCA|nr:hypothetical protein C0Q70_11108 [Pomacea canaliculata]